TLPLIIFYLYFIKEIKNKLHDKSKWMYFFLSLSVYLVLAFVKGTPAFNQLFIPTILAFGVLKLKELKYENSIHL
ncbi:MAG: hypothetical protein PHE08_09140, partial [Bacteroidales bacterium]|nr:hypothetical protein [Bacteroidales bacterium]